MGSVVCQGALDCSTSQSRLRRDTSVGLVKDADSGAGSQRRWAGNEPEGWVELQWAGRSSLTRLRFVARSLDAGALQDKLRLGSPGYCSSPHPFAWATAACRQTHVRSLQRSFGPAPPLHWVLPSSASPVCHHRETRLAASEHFEDVCLQADFHRDVWSLLAGGRVHCEGQGTPRASWG